uniref:Uncharacterized protein n=1 Tax=Aegilops tauschii subsp. strangulata TaxID=200361 RepID=A0A453BNZ8_AEGTS
RGVPRPTASCFSLSGRVRKVLDEYGRVCPYMGFYIPDMKVASTAEGPKECLLNL